jgi:hypothetical protein
MNTMQRNETGPSLVLEQEGKLGAIVCSQDGVNLLFSVLWAFSSIIHFYWEDLMSFSENYALRDNWDADCEVGGVEWEEWDGAKREENIKAKTLKTGTMRSPENQLQQRTQRNLYQYPGRDNLLASSLVVLTPGQTQQSKTIVRWLHGHVEWDDCEVHSLTAECMSGG